MPQTLTDCNCSLCRRLGGLWAYYEAGTVVVDGHPDRSAEYIQGDRTLRTLRCATCGCVTHWEPLAPKAGSRQGVNFRNFDPAVVATIRVRHLDGAESWQYLD